MLVLRDSSRSENLRAAIRAVNGRAYPLPLFRFETIFDCPVAQNFLSSPQGYSHLIFASPNGVSSLRKFAMRHNLPLPYNIRTAGPGPATSKAIVDAGFVNVAMARGTGDLASLLKSHDLGKMEKVAFVQREFASARALHEFKRMRAVAVPIPCYRWIEDNEDAWEHIPESLRGSFNSIIAFDAATLELLLQRCKDDVERIKKMPVGVIHPAIAEKASALGYENIIVAGESKKLIDDLRTEIGHGGRTGKSQQ